MFLHVNQDLWSLRKFTQACSNAPEYHEIRNDCVESRSVVESSVSCFNVLLTSVIGIAYCCALDGEVEVVIHSLLLLIVSFVVFCFAKRSTRSDRRYEAASSECKPQYLVVVWIHRRKKGDARWFCLLMVNEMRKTGLFLKLEDGRNRVVNAGDYKPYRKWVSRALQQWALGSLEACVTSQVMIHPDYSKPVMVMSDASAVGMGPLLWQLRHGYLTERASL